MKIPYRLLLLGITLLAGLMRAAGSNYGLPEIYHQDEPIIMNHALSIGVGGWNTHFFIIPPFTMYLQFILSGIYYAVGQLLGIFAGTEDFALKFLADPSALYLLGRWGTAVIPGTLTVLILALGSRSWAGDRVSLWAALFLGISHLAVQQSHYLYADTLLTAVSTLWVLGLCRWARAERLKSLWPLGILLGLGTSIKYTMVFFVPALIAALWMRRRRGDMTSGYLIKSVLGAGLVSVTVFGVSAPYTFLDWTQFVSQMTTQTGAQYPVSWHHHWTYSLQEGMGPLLWLAPLGWVLLWRRQDTSSWILLMAAAGFYASNLVVTQGHARYVLPLVPLLCLMAAYAFDALWARIRFPLLAGISVLVVTGVSAAPSFYSDFLFIQKDTRTLAKEWVQTHIPENSLIIVDNRFHAPHLVQTPEQWAEKRRYLEGGAKDRARARRLTLMESVARTQKSYRIYLMAVETDEKNFPFLSVRPTMPPDWEAVRRLGAEYLILNYAEKWPQIHALKDAHRDDLERVAVFSPYRRADKRQREDLYDLTAAPLAYKELFSRNRLGPYLEIYRVRPGGDSRV